MSLPAGMMKKESDKKEEADYVISKYRLYYR